MMPVPRHPLCVPFRRCRRLAAKSAHRRRADPPLASLARPLALERSSLGLELEVVGSARWRLPIGDSTVTVFRATGGS